MLSLLPSLLVSVPPAATSTRRCANLVVCYESHPGEIVQANLCRDGVRLNGIAAVDGDVGQRLPTLPQRSHAEPVTVTFWQAVI